MRSESRAAHGVGARPDGELTVGAACEESVFGQRHNVLAHKREHPGARTIRTPGAHSAEHNGGAGSRTRSKPDDGLRADYRAGYYRSSDDDVPSRLCYSILLNVITDTYVRSVLRPVELYENPLVQQS